MRYLITATDQYGSHHPIGEEPFEADTPEAAIAIMCEMAGVVDDGSYQAAPEHAILRDTGIKRGTYPILAVDV